MLRDDVIIYLMYFYHSQTLPSCTLPGVGSQYYRVNVFRLEISDAAKLHPQSYVTTKVFLNILRPTSSSNCKFHASI
jgi:hypothetical protein